MPPPRELRAATLAPYFEIQLRLAARMAELTGSPLGDMAWRYTNLHRRLGLGLPGEAPGEEWTAFAAQLEAAVHLGDQVRVTQTAFRYAAEEQIPLPGQTGFGCFACDPPNDEGVVRIHFFNADTDAAGGPLASAKIGRRRAELAAMTRHIRRSHPEARSIRGKSWLYHLEAYRRLFPPDYVAAPEVAEGPLHLQGTSSWGQMIDSRERVRPEIRDALIANLPGLSPETPWQAFPLRVLTVAAPLESFEASYAAVAAIGSPPD
jgi:hypothetical protein